MNLEQLTDAVWQRLQENSPRALLLGDLPDDLQKFYYVNEEPYEAVVIGRLSPAGLLAMPTEPVCTALLEGKPVYLYRQGWEKGTAAQALRRELVAAENRLRRLGALPVETGFGLVTAEKARQLLRSGIRPAAGSRLTPLARDILEGKSN